MTVQKGKNRHGKTDCPENAFTIHLIDLRRFSFKNDFFIYRTAAIRTERRIVFDFFPAIPTIHIPLRYVHNMYFFTNYSTYYVQCQANGR